METVPFWGRGFGLAMGKWIKYLWIRHLKMRLGLKIMGKVAK